MVSEVFLHRLDVVTVLQGGYGEAMTKIVKSHFGDSHLAHNFLKMLPNRYMGEMSARDGLKNQARNILMP